MCTCNPNNKEEYHTAFPEFETSIPEDPHMSTRYYEEAFIPQYTSTPRRIVQQDYQRGIPRSRLRSTPRRLDLTTGVAIVLRRIDFDAVSDVEDTDVEEDMGEVARETLQRLQSAAQRPIQIPESTVAPGTYRLKRARATQYPSDYKRQHVPRMVRVTPCGKCLRV